MPISTGLPRQSLIFCRLLDLHRVAQAVVDLLPVVVQGHDFQGNLLAPGLSLRLLFRLAAVHITTLVQLGLSRGIDARAEGVDVVEALPLQGADVLAEQGEHQGLLRLEHLQAAQEDPAQGQPGDTHCHYRDSQRVGTAEPGGLGGLLPDGGPHQSHNSYHIQGQNEQQHGHTLLLALQNLLFHMSTSALFLISKSYHLNIDLSIHFVNTL